jgi:HEAT repeat protein
MVLDPLADAVETLVHSNGDAPSTEALALAQDVVNPAVASRLVQRMGHEDDDGRRQDYVVMSQRLGTVMAKAFRGALTDSTDPRARRTFYDALIAMGDTSRPMIEAMVEDDNRFLVRNAVAILGEIGGARAVELVTSALANTDGRVRREALHSLAKLGGEESPQLVLAFLEDPDAEVRAAAAGAAGALKVERALKPILALLEGEDAPEVLVEVLGGLGRLGDPGAVQAIEKLAVGSLFSKPATEVRVAAYRALHAIGTPHARDLIAKAKDDKDPVVRTTARQLPAVG